MNDLEEKDVDEFHSAGFQCPTCFAAMETKCDSELKWCTAGRRQCVACPGIINTGTFLEGSIVPSEQEALSHKITGHVSQG